MGKRFRNEDFGIVGSTNPNFPRNRRQKSVVQSAAAVIAIQDSDVRMSKIPTQ